MKPELLSPASDFVSLRAAIQGGCDSVYFGVKELNMRMAAKNFKLSEIKKVVDVCHKNNVKAYLTLNVVIYDNEIKKLKKIMEKAGKAKIDGIICWDFSVIRLARKLNIPFHISTQASASNFDAVKFYSKLGAKRIILARELNLKQIKKIINRIKKERLNIGVETFVHGAMCISISGRCFLSQKLFGKSANRGECLQPCRRSYRITDKETGDELDVGRDYVLSPKDLCALPFIDKLISLGISTFKIEGRNRNPEYVKTVTECYREAIDAVYEKRFDKKLVKNLVQRLKRVYNRGFSSGFYLGLPTDEDYTKYYGSAAKTKKDYIGFVRNYYRKPGVAEIKLEANSVKLGDNIMFQGNKTGVFEQKIKSMEIKNKKVERAAKGMVVGVKVDKVVRKNDRVYLLTIRK